MSIEMINLFNETYTVWVDDKNSEDWFRNVLAQLGYTDYKLAMILPRERTFRQLVSVHSGRKVDHETNKPLGQFFVNSRKGDLEKLLSMSRSDLFAPVIYVSATN